MAAVRKGDIPTDPAVLIAGIRLGGLFLGRPSIAAAAQLMTDGLAVVAAIVLAVLSAADGAAGRVLVWSALALLVGASVVWKHYRRRSVERNLAALREAAGSDAGGLDETATTGAEVSAAVARRTWIWIYGAGAVVLIGCLAVVHVLTRPSPDCRVARDVINYINDHRDVIASNPATTSGSPNTVADYQRWVDQLHVLAGQASEPSVVLHLQRILELSTQTTTVVRESAADAAGPTDTAQRQRVSAYSGIVRQIVDEETQLIDACRLR